MSGTGRTSRAVRLFCLGLPLSLVSLGLAAKEYLDFPVYKALKDLAPELPQARLHSGLAPAGYELWERGQLWMPAQDFFLRADLRETGREDCAILLDVPAGEKTVSYILIASRSRESWSRLFLQQLEEGTLIHWNAGRKAIEIPSAEGIRVTSPATMSWGSGVNRHAAYGYTFDVHGSAYVRWNASARRFEHVRAADAAFNPWLSRTNLDSYESLPADKFESVHIRLSALRGSWPNLYLLSPGYAPNPEFFRLYRRRGIDFGGGNRGFDTLVVSAWQIQDVVRAIRNLANVDVVLQRSERDANVEYAVSILRIDPDPHFCELLLTRQEAEALESHVARITGRRNPFQRPKIAD